MTTILDRIRSYKLDEISDGKRARPLGELEADTRAAPEVRPFAEALSAAAARGAGLIAEVKKASPSKGLIRAGFDPAAIARGYEAGGAACLSVLTDGPSFQGAPAHLEAARAACSLPVLRKDFLYDPWQVTEARAMGADCILIIMASVSDAQAAELEAAAQSWRMDVLIEVHDAEELDRALRLSSRLIGINNRDLRTFETSLDVTRGLVASVPKDRDVVSESGLSTPSDLAGMAAYGVRRFLIGESLMRQPDVAATTRTLLGGAAVAASVATGG